MKRIVLSFMWVLLAHCCLSQSAYDVYISNNGNDLNAGTDSLLPKKTINGTFSHPGNAGVSSMPVKVALQSGSTFNETFNAGFPMHVASYGTTSNSFAVLNGTNVFDTGWVKTPGRNNLYEQAISLTGFTGYGINNVGQYSFVYVYEVDKLLEKTAPFTARKLLRFVYSVGQADAAPGSFFEPITTDENPKKIYIHTSDGNEPGQNPRFRYEVSVRDRAINVTNEEGNSFENLWVRGYGAGNGMISAGANSSFNRLIFGPGAGIHHLALRGAAINNSLFLPAAKNVTSYAVVFYDVEGFGRHNSISNSIFLDIKDPVYTHHSYGSNFGALELNNVFAFADSNDVGGFVQNMDTDSIFLRNAYSYQYKYGYSYGWAKYVDIQNSGFIDVLHGVSFGHLNTTASVSNTFIKTKGTDNLCGIEFSYTVKLALSNSIIHFRSDGKGTNPVAGALVARAGLRENFINATGNIFICDVDPSRKVLAATVNTSNGKATTTDRWKNNVYILLRGSNIYWKVTNPVTNNGSADVYSFEEWKKQSGQDKQSLFFDLRNDPRGLKAIFADPENGDYELANTIEGNKVRALRAGMTKAISCFVKKPTYEEAAAIIMNRQVNTADVCRNPCVQNNIRGFSLLELKQLAGRKVQVKWKLEDERGVDHYEVLRSFGTNDFVSIGLAFPAGDAILAFTDSLVLPGVEYRYSVAVLSKAGSKCYFDTRACTIENEKRYAVYPNPSTGKIRIAINNFSGKVTVKICNALGMVLYSNEFTSLSGSLPLIDLSSLPKGLYWAKIETDKTTVQSFLLQ